MDQLDADILRELCRGRVLLWGGGDPRLGMTEIADRVGVDRTTVWSRLKGWREDGFLRHQEVVPNPGLFGAGMAGGAVRVEDPRRKADALDAIQLVDGVLAGFDQVGPYVIVQYAVETRSALTRCTRLLEQLPTVDEVSMCVPFETPQSTLEPTPRDWRILDALRAAPDRPLKDVAKDLGVSRSTLTRRYRELLEANAIWSFPVLDFTNYRGAVMARFLVTPTEPARSADLVNACQRELDEMVWWMSLEDLTPTEEDLTPWVDVYCHLDAAAAVEEVQTWLLDLPMVDEVEVFFPRTWYVVDAWFDERIERELQTTP